MREPVIDATMGEQMQAFQFVKYESPFEWREVPVPEPGPGEALVAVAGAGACHSDLYFPIMSAEALALARPPFTIGHEITGHVAELGEGSDGIDVGTPVAVSGAWGCGACRSCRVHGENYCERERSAERKGRPGLSRDGGMAPFVAVPAKYLVPLGDVDPVSAAPLTDAGLTPYHAIKRHVGRLVPGTRAVVIGIGGLGHLAVQLLKRLSPVEVIAVDVDSAQLDLATEVGADHVVRSDADAAEAIRHHTAGAGAELVLDIVGIDTTLELAAAVVRSAGAIIIVGVGPGSFPMGFRNVPHGVAVNTTFWGTTQDLYELIALANRSPLRVEVERFPLSEAEAAYRRLDAGQVRGRAVMVPADDQPAA